MDAYSVDLRTSVLDACDRRLGTVDQIAEIFGVSRRWIYKIKQQRRETGSIEPKPHGGGHPPALDESGMERLKGLLEAHPDATESELIDLIGVSMSTSAMGRAIRTLGYSRKKDAQGGGAGASGRA